MGMPDAHFVVKVLKSMPGYVDAFKAAFPGEADPISYDNFGKAVGAFERKLLTPSRWDDFLKGKEDALTAEEKKGFENAKHYYKVRQYKAAITSLENFTKNFPDSKFL
jgi:cytochrome c peroxidase